MLLFKKYDKKLRLEEAWFDSSMLFYSKMVEDAYENKGDLYVTFNNGATYIYKGVKFEDYILFIAGGTDGSQGKTLNKVIKPAYDVVKTDPMNINDLKERMDSFKREEENEKTDKENTFFISGHRDLTEEEFEVNYKESIIVAVDSSEYSRFVVGDFNGCDIMAQDFLLDVLKIDPERVTVYHMGDKPTVYNEKVTNFKGGFKSHEERDASMTNVSASDIAFVRDNTKISGTAMNILRRNLLKTV